jgi:predicted secreted acid phosphatase
MARRLLLVLLCCAVLLPAGVVSPAQAAFPSKKQWLSDVDKAMTGSKSFVKRRVGEGGTKLAINLDIDNTSLATHYDKGKAIHRVLDFTQYARDRGVVLVFNTGRLVGDGRLKRAERALAAVGYPATRICGRATPDESLAHSKQRCRQRFVDQGFTLIVNVGNRATDFVGGNYERAFRLPNYHNQLG